MIKSTYEQLAKTIDEKMVPIITWLKKHGVNTTPRLWWMYALIVSIFAYANYYQKIYDYITEHYDAYLRKFYNALSNNWLNVLFLIGIIYLTIVVLRTIIKDRLFSWQRLFVEIFALVVLLYHNQWVFATLPLCGNYKGLFIAVFAILVFAELLKYKLQVPNNAENNPDVLGYIADDDFSAEEDHERRVNLCQEIVNRVLVTDISKESFSVGITGGWGTGKTTMLNSIKDSIGDRAYVVEFNPWNSQSASQIITDFFSEIRNSLSDNYRTLAKPIMRYANLLADIPLNPVEKWVVSKVSGYVENDLSGSKELLSRELKKLDRPLVVLIDDTDRLESSEMFEVLRLVRNTAKLPNVIYFVAYDKTYLVGQLKEKHIPDAAQYVEKIFPLEIAMPYAEKHMLISALYYDINKMLHSTQFTDWLYRNMSYADMTSAVEILGSYRQVKRFARIYVTELRYMQSVFKKSELNIIDLFWLTMLQLTSHKTYESMFRSPESILDAEAEGNLRVYKLKDPLPESLKDDTKKILTKLFSRNNSPVNNGIRYCDNYFNYFYMGLERGRISIQELEELLSAGEEIDNKMKEVCNKKSSQSIYHRLNGYNFKRDDLHSVISYFTVLTAWMNLQSHHLMSFLFAERLTIYYIEEVYRKEFSNWFVHRMESIINATNNFHQVSEVLNKLYPMYPIDMDGDEAIVRHTHVISPDSIKCLCRLVFTKYLEHHPNEDAYNILDKGTPIGSLYRSFSLATEYYIPDDASFFQNFVIDDMIAYFEQHKSLNYQKASQFFELTEEDRQSGYADEISMQKSQDKEFLFGTDGNKFAEYLDKCFIH